MSEPQIFWKQHYAIKTYDRNDFWAYVADIANTYSEFCQELIAGIRGSWTMQYNFERCHTTLFLQFWTDSLTDKITDLTN